MCKLFGFILFSKSNDIKGQKGYKIKQKSLKIFNKISLVLSLDSSDKEIFDISMNQSQKSSQKNLYISEEDFSISQFSIK